MKRALLIAGGTVGGLGAVLAITPPQLGSSNSIDIAGGTGMGSVSSSASASSTTSPSSGATKSSKPVATKKATAAATAAAATTEPAPQAPAASTTAVSGTFTGPSVNVNYGNVQVQITVVNGRITDAKAVVAGWFVSRVTA
jgi:uncharacterized protein with FMN-binding domain